MGNLKPNPFWTGVALAIGALALVTGLLIVPRSSRILELRKEVRGRARALEAALPGTPSREDVASWSRYKGDLTASYVRIASFYAESDRHFERWFPELTLGLNGAPSRDAFVTRYRGEVQKLEAALRGASVRIGPENDDRAPGFNWEELKIQQLDDVGPADETIVLHEVQKRYWARRHVADVLLTGKVRVHRIVDFRFFKRLHDRIREEVPLGGGAELVDWPGVPGAAPGKLPRDFQETVLPNGLGRTLTFGVVLELPSSEVARTLRESLNPGSEASSRDRMLISLIGSQVTIREQNAVSVKVEHEEGNSEELKRKEKEMRKSVKPRNVLLALTFQIIDFDPGRVKSF